MSNKILLTALLTFFSIIIYAQTPAAYFPNKYLKLLKKKNVGLIVNHSSTIGEVHLVDYLRSKQINIKAIFAPEHGFRGNADRGKHIKDSKDAKTGIPIISLHGKNKKPQPHQLKGIDILVFDIQDVGVRFFTYISTMHYGMEAAAENGLNFLVLDRPNPLGDYVAGPVLKKELKSFVGMHPIPVVHGLTVGELAQMIKGEKWINKAEQLNLKVIKCENYTHLSQYTLPIKPSPNLPNMTAIRLYPSLCFFEATNVSVGRGTLDPFQQIGFPDPKMGKHSFHPKDIKGMQMNPIQEGKTCFGIDLRQIDPWKHKFTLKYLLNFQKKFNNKKMISRERWFNLLAGNKTLKKKIEQTHSILEIEKSWMSEILQYKSIRKQYLLYEDFE